MTCTVRSVDDPDRKRWRALFTAYLGFYEVEVQNDNIMRVWNWIADPDNDFWGVLAVNAEGRAVGLAHYQLMHNSLAGSVTCYLADLFVEPSERGGGVGRLLVDHVLSFARDRGLPAVDWLTEETNYAGRRLYDTYRPRTELVFYSVPT